MLAPSPAPSPPPTDGGGVDDGDDDDGGTAVRAPRDDRAGVVHAHRPLLRRMEADGCRPCLDQLRRLQRPLVVRRLIMAGASANGDAAQGRAW